MPPAEAPAPLPSNGQGLIAALQAALTAQASPEQYGKVLTCEARQPLQRQAIGLPPDSLVTNERLLATHRHIKGIHYADVTLNGPQSFRCIRKEVANLQAIRVLWGGNPTVWVVIPPRHSDKLESRVTECLKTRPRCSQFVRHEKLIIPPATLEKWGISFSIFVQYPGEVVKIDYLAYSYTWHTGADKSETVNCSEDDWNFPPMYKFCRKSLKCRTESHVTADALTIGTTRPLSFTEDDKNNKEELTDAGSSLEAEPQRSSLTQQRLDHPLPVLHPKTELEQSPRVAPQDLEEDEDPSVYLYGFPSPSDTTTNPATPKSSDENEGSRLSIEDLFQPTDVPDYSPSDHEGHSPGSEYFISTRYASQRRLPGQEAHRVVGTPPLNSPASTEVPDDDNKSDASEYDEQWSNMSEGGLPTGMDSLTMDDDDSFTMIMSKTARDPATMASERGLLTTAAQKDGGWLQGYLVTPPHSNSTTGSQEVIQEIEHLINLGIKQSQHFKWYSPRQTTDKSALAV
nr:hypothetical protein [Nostoc sp. EkiNYC01]